MGEQEAFVSILTERLPPNPGELAYTNVRQKFQFFSLLANEKEEKFASNAIKQFINLINLYQELT